jgi:hypothetical protein
MEEEVAYKRVRNSRKCVEMEEVEVVIPFGRK